MGTVRGVGRKRQGLAHMQSGTVTDINAVVDNCSVALQEAEEMAGFRPTQVVIGIAGELVKGFTTTHSQERKRADSVITDAELQKLIDGVQREALREGGAGHHLGDRPAAGGRASGPRRRHGRPDRRLPGHQPGRLQRAARQDQHLQRLRAAGPPGRAADRGPAAGAGSAGDRRRAVRRGAGPRQRAGPAVRRALHRHRRRHDGRGPGPPRRHRGDAHVRPRRPRLHEVHRGPPGSALPAGRGDQGGLRPGPEGGATLGGGEDHLGGRGHLVRGRGAGPGRAGRRETSCPAGSTCAAAARISRRSERRCPASCSGSGCRSAARRRLL